MQGAAWFLSVVVIGINMFFVAEYVVSFVLTLVYNVMLYINDLCDLLHTRRTYEKSAYCELYALNNLLQP